MYCMRSFSARVLSLCLIVLMSCTKKELEDLGIDVDDPGPIGIIETSIGFLVYPLGAPDYQFDQASIGINVEVGDNLVFLNTSFYTYSDNSTAPATNVEWTFAGADIETSTEGENEFTINYLDFGDYTLSLEIKGDGAKTETFEGFVSVQPLGTLKSYPIESEERDNGKSTLYFYNIDRDLERIENFDNGVLVERQDILLNEDGSINVRNFFLDGVYQGADVYQYNDSGHMTFERRKDAADNPLYEYNFNVHEDGYAVSAELKVWDPGGQFNINILYGYNEDFTVVEEEVLTGDVEGRIEWTWDDSPAKFDGLVFLEYAKRYSRNNPISKTTYDGGGIMISQEVYGYNYSSLNGGKPISAQHETNGEITNIEWRYGITYEY